MFWGPHASSMFSRAPVPLRWEVPEALRPHRQAPERGGARPADKWRRPGTPTLLQAACVLLTHWESETRTWNNAGFRPP